jgi:hypothetical protein
MVDPDKISVGDLNASFTSIDRTSRQKVNKDILDFRTKQCNG